MSIVGLKRAVCICAVALLQLCSIPAFSFEVREVASIRVSPANANVFATSLAWFNGAVYTVNVEPAEWIDTGVNLRTVVRKGIRKDNGKWHWQYHVISEGTLNDPYHNQASIAIDRDGYVHVAYNMHNMPWQYSVSVRPGDISEFEFRGDTISLVDRVLVKHLNKTPFPSIGTAAIPGNQVTYPAFFNDRQGNLYVTYRFATRPKRRFADRGFAGGIARYHTETRAWEPLGGVLQVTSDDAEIPGGRRFASLRAFAYTDRWSVYLIRLAFDRDNNMHVSWLWRRGGAGPTTSHPSYAYSRDGGKSFLDGRRNTYELPIEVGDADLVLADGGNRKFAPNTVVEVDDARTPYVLIHEVGRVRSLVHWDGRNEIWSKPEEMPFSAPEFIIQESGRQWAFATGPVILCREDKGAPWKIMFESSEDVKYGYPQALQIPGEDKMLLYTQNTEAGLAKIYMIDYGDD